MPVAMLTARNHRVVARSAAVSIQLHRRPFCSGAAGVGTSSSPNADISPDGREIRLGAKIPEYDVAIIGGGMVGMALGCALSSMPLTKHLNVAIVDANPALGQQESFKKNDIPDPRVSTVTPANISFFKEVGAWKYVQQQRHAFFDKMQVWDYTGLGYTRYSAKDIGKQDLGCVVENKVLHYSLLSSLQSNADFQKTIYVARLNSMTFPSQTTYTKMKDGLSESKLAPSGTEPHKEEHYRQSLIKLDMSDGNSLYAKLVVGADGGKSRVREIAGLKTTGWKYSQNAVICTVEHDVENHCAWQRFLPSGPIALLPIGDRFSNIVWSMSPEESSERKSMSHEEFVNAVNHALDYGYGPYPRSSFVDQYLENFSFFTGPGAASVKENFQVPPKVINVASERMVFPLSLMHAHDYAAKGVVLIGDAAHTVHPLAGQGVNLGFGDAYALSKVIAEGISVGTDIGELSLLKKYEKERKATNIAMMAFLDGFQKAFSVDLGPLNLIRAAAFHGAQYIAPLKKNIISYATAQRATSPIDAWITVEQNSFKDTVDIGTAEEVQSGVVHFYQQRSLTVGSK